MKAINSTCLKFLLVNTFMFQMCGKKEQKKQDSNSNQPIASEDSPPPLNLNEDDADSKSLSKNSFLGSWVLQNSSCFLTKEAWERTGLLPEYAEKLFQTEDYIQRGDFSQTLTFDESGRVHVKNSFRVALQGLQVFLNNNKHLPFQLFQLNSYIPVGLTSHFNWPHYLYADLNFESDWRLNPEEKILYFLPVLPDSFRIPIVYRVGHDVIEPTRSHESGKMGKIDLPPIESLPQPSSSHAKRFDSAIANHIGHTLPDSTQNQPIKKFRFVEFNEHAQRLILEGSGTWEGAPFHICAVEPVTFVYLKI